ncbi:MAG: extracellular solute-binding protein [Oscillospiraceae bacterium]|nr:extracellular solute-binding protein [Oscillospiraceae bacterium]
MKEKLLRPLALTIVAALLVSVLAGCNRDGGGDTPTDSPGSAPGTAADAPDYIFVPEFVTFPPDMSDIANISFFNQRIYFSTTYWTDEGESLTRLFSMDVDGTGVEELVGFSPAELPEGSTGGFMIQALSNDADGNIWVAENGMFWGFDLPEDEDVDPEDMWQFQSPIGSITLVRKLDGTGAELLSFDISGLGDPDAGPFDQFFVSGLTVDGDGNIFVASNRTIFVLDSNGALQFTLEAPNWIERLARFDDGSVALAGFLETGAGIRMIDTETEEWGEDVEFPDVVTFVRHAFAGGGEFEALFSDNAHLYGIEAGTGEAVRLLNLIDSDIQGDSLFETYILPDGRILAITRSFGAGGTAFELVLLTPMPYGSVPERTVITLGTMNLHWRLRTAVVDFNRASSTHRIQVLDFSEFNTADDMTAGLTRLTTEILAGRVPDMLEMSALPFRQYVARGLLVDLYDFIDADPELSRDDFMESVFRASEVDGSLYQVFTSFTINTLLGSPEVLGEGMGWTFDEFRDVLRANPQADIPLGAFMTNRSFLSRMIQMNVDDFVDWNNGTVNFESDDFIQLLELADLFPAEPDSADFTAWLDAEMISEGRQIMIADMFGEFGRIQLNMAFFGGDIVFKGFPSSTGVGQHALALWGGIAITSPGENQQAAWEFVRSILSEEWQYEALQMGGGLPTNRAAFDRTLERTMTPSFWMDEDGNEVEMPQATWGTMGSDVFITVYAMTQDEADQLMELIDAVSGMTSVETSLMNIVNEGADDFFAGRRTAQDAARVIQSRASIFIAEQT